MLKAFKRKFSDLRSFVEERKLSRALIVLAGVGMCAGAPNVLADDQNDISAEEQESKHGDRYANYFLSSFGTNQLMMFNENTGKFKKIVYPISKPVASQIGFDGDLFIPSFDTGNVYRFDGFTGGFKGIFVRGGEGGLTNPSAPNFGPDDLMYIGDFATNKILRFDKNGKFVDVFADHETSGLSQPYMPTFDATSFYIASGGTNSILRWDIKTKEFLGAFVPPGSGGLVHPVGLEFGPDGNLYAGSNGTNAVIRYNGKTGEFIDVFVPPGTGGIDNPFAVRFGGRNSNLYVVSNNTNEVMEYDRVTGDFIRVVSDGDSSGLKGARGLTFTPRPIFNVEAKVVGDAYSHGTHWMKHISIEHILKDYSDDSPRVKLISIVSSDKYIDIDKAVRHADFGRPDYSFDVDFNNRTGVAQHYTVTYSASNRHGLSTIATTEINVPPR
ncbi:hypothetical protein [Massilia sp. erpn]|uniref:Vgb family protein n=1 Tax=Massilia sp. erpn TaxID=2738142 RepID=UPI002101F021|nr:hypothetical protein [Massilia sp. erpn]UTY59278.1 hypothetical protein HPQ68_20125 [Massilia sp. erpn]